MKRNKMKKQNNKITKKFEKNETKQNNETSNEIKTNPNEKLRNDIECT